MNIASHLSFIVPVHNEQESLQELHRKIVDVCSANTYSYELIFVDDGSEDKSFEIIRSIAAKDSHVKAIKLRRNFGQTAALSAGIHASRAPIIITLDADLQNDPADVPRLLQKLREGYDIASGWRKERQDSFAKKWPSKLANSVISRVTGVRLSDYGCTLKAYKREYLEHTPLYGDMHRFVPVLAAWHGAKVGEVEVHHHPRTHGKSHYGLFGRTVRVLLDLLTVKFLHTYVARPMHFFGSVGFIFMGLGCVTGIATIILKLLHIRDFVATPLPLFTLFLIILGVQALLMGLIAELLIRIYFEQSGRLPYHIEESIGIEHTQR